MHDDPDLNSVRFIGEGRPVRVDATARLVRSDQGSRTAAVITVVQRPYLLPTAPLEIDLVS